MPKPLIPIMQADPVIHVKTAENFVLTFGKHKGQSLGNVASFNPDYIVWIIENLASSTTEVRYCKVLMASNKYRQVLQDAKEDYVNYGMGIYADQFYDPYIYENPDLWR